MTHPSTRPPVRTPALALAAIVLPALWGLSTTGATDGASLERAAVVSERPRTIIAAADDTTVLAAAVTTTTIAVPPTPTSAAPARDELAGTDLASDEPAAAPTAAPTAPTTTTAPPPPAPTTTTTAPPASAASTGTTRDTGCESAMVTWMNDDRRRAGVAPLVHDGAIAHVPVDWSRTMAERSDLRHNPDYSGQIFAVRPEAYTAAENVGRGGGGDARAVYDQFFRSEPHRVKILGGQFSHVAVGCVWDAAGELWVTVDFWG